MPEVQLHGPNDLSCVYRVGDTVRRGWNFWTPTVPALLRHFEAVSFDAVPRVVGIDERGREILSLKSGDAPSFPDKPWNFRSARGLREVGRIIRRFHDTTLTLAPPADARWRGILADLSWFRRNRRELEGLLGAARSGESSHRSR